MNGPKRPRMASGFIATLSVTMNSRRESERWMRCRFRTSSRLRAGTVTFSSIERNRQSATASQPYHKDPWRSPTATASGSRSRAHEADDGAADYDQDRRVDVAEVQDGEYGQGDQAGDQVGNRDPGHGIGSRKHQANRHRSHSALDRGAPWVALEALPDP